MRGLRSLPIQVITCIGLWPSPPLYSPSPPPYSPSPLPYLPSPPLYSPSPRPCRPPPAKVPPDYMPRRLSPRPSMCGFGDLSQFLLKIDKERIVERNISENIPTYFGLPSLAGS